jgi:hypothetical protein
VESDEESDLSASDFDEAAEEDADFDEENDEDFDEAPKKRGRKTTKAAPKGKGKANAPPKQKTLPEKPTTPKKPTLAQPKRIKASPKENIPEQPKKKETMEILSTAVKEAAEQKNDEYYKFFN